MTKMKKKTDSVHGEVNAVDRCKGLGEKMLNKSCKKKIMSMIHFLGVMELR